MKYALITGANKGIGFGIAQGLVKKGVHVILTARDAQKGKEAAQKLGASFVQLDVTNRKSIEQACKDVLKITLKIDYLIHNAGILLDFGKSVFDISEQTLDQTLKTNLYGVLTLTQAIKPQLAKNARIVVLSSRGGQLSGELEKPFAPAYCISKTAVNMLTQALASELEGMCVNCMCPGWVKTDLGGSSAPKSIEEGADTAIWLCLEASSFTGKYIAERKEIPW